MSEGELVEATLRRPCRACAGTGLELDPAKVGPALAARRLRLGVEAKAVAKALGLSRSYLCDAEHGRKFWSEAFRARYEKALAKLAAQLDKEDA